MADPIEVDVCVVGAGYAGLTAALRVQQAGLTVAVLEARDRVGGRIWTEHAPDGSAIDRGGAWFAPYHDAAFRLAHEMGVSTYKTYVAGKHLLVDGSTIRRYTGLIPKISPLAVVSIALNQARIDRMARTVPLSAPWTAPKAKQWDARSVGSLVDRARIRSSIGHALFEMAVRGLFATDLHDVSLLHLFFLVNAHGGINKLFSISGGAQENLVDGGAGSIAQRVAERLGDSVHLRAPVRSIVHHDDGVVVSGDELVVRARHAIVAVPPALALEIRFDPALSDDRVALYRVALGGVETKTLVIYDEPFWRAGGYSGQSADPGSVSEVTIDASPANAACGVLASFTFGPVAARIDALESTARRDALLTALATRFGEQAKSPAAIVETPWYEQEWTRGCSFAHLPMGALTRHGHLLREPFGRVHWAGTETATTSHGAVDGAIRSGERAAGEIVARA